MSEHIDNIETEVIEVYGSIDKIKEALADGKITADEASQLLIEMEKISKDVPIIINEGHHLIDEVESRVERDIDKAQDSKLFNAVSTLWSEFSLANVANVLYAFLELLLPESPHDENHDANKDLLVLDLGSHNDKEPDISS